MIEAYWEQRWQTNQTGWDLRQASPPLTQFADYAKEQYSHLRVLIPGCGSGYEALHLLDSGYENITMLDISPTAVSKLQNMLIEQKRDWRANLRLVCADFFQHTETYHLILEQTFFCALDPSLREKYAQKMFDLLEPGGVLAGVLFDRNFDGGPPFGGNQHEYRGLFSPLFQIEIMEPCRNSVGPRADSELFILMRKP